jgi:hypothetical protein
VSTPDTGGPAFPRIEPATGGNGPNIYFGMTLRDYFAAQVIGHLVCAEVRGDYSTQSDAAYAYEVADAMLKARQS